MLVAIHSIPAAQAQTPPTVYVATNGVDASTCGAQRSPCRSIGRAITNAAVGATVLVGPGRYGDLNENGVFGEPGEEAAPAACSCMILLNKRLHLVSRDGPSATLLDANGARLFVVRVTASRAILGDPFNGFTLTHSGLGAAVLVDAPEGVSVMGNIASSSVEGIAIQGVNHRLTGNIATDNQGHGFNISGSGHRVRFNVATRNPAAPESRFTVAGFRVTGGMHQLRDNVASGNDFGFVVGFGDDSVLIGNAVVSNRFTGIVIESPPGARLTIRRNNIFGNSTRPATLSFNCGLSNGSGDSVRAPDNFWGARGGPGVDPADGICGGSPVITAPFATQEVVLDDSLRMN